MDRATTEAVADGGRDGELIGISVLKEVDLRSPVVEIFDTD